MFNCESRLKAAFSPIKRAAWRYVSAFFRPFPLKHRHILHDFTFSVCFFRLFPCQGDAEGMAFTLFLLKQAGLACEDGSDCRKQKKDEIREPA